MATAAGIALLLLAVWAVLASAKAEEARPGRTHAFAVSSTADAAGTGTGGRAASSGQERQIGTAAR